MKKSSFIFAISILAFSTTTQSMLTHDSCINALDSSFRTHYSILATGLIQNNGDNPLVGKETEIINSFNIIKKDCNEEIYKMSVRTFGHIYFGSEVEDSQQQRCIAEIYGAYMYVMLNEVNKKAPALGSESEMKKISNELIDSLKKSENCSAQVKNKILHKIKA
ncbi:MAG: hypothetical protein HYX61_13385 [Gammaproteobacteria bacterium]|jgi:hypothetical protein|nr:hypothetical protein [Gammaproteobacteria bacterium]